MPHRPARSSRRVFGRPWRRGLDLVYDVAHNIAKFEEHASAEAESCCVHRKGATRAFPPGHPEIPAAYRGVGQPVIIPGDMGRPAGCSSASPAAWSSRSAPPATAPAG